jgi:uncharacterized repeat protein (TIGR01451 family)
LLGLLGLLGARDADAQAITRYVRDTGRINFVTTGGSLRNSASNTCNLNNTSTTALSGIPNGTTIRNAYLYWGGSGSLDNSVTLNGNTVTATRTFSATYTGVSPSLPFFGAFANVTGIVNTTRNGNYTLGNLTVQDDSPHCDVSAVVSGWSLIVVYESASERLRAINLYDGLAPFRGSQVVLNPDGFRVPSTNIDGRIAVFTLEGDPANSGAMNNISEALRYNNNTLNDGINVAGSDPLVQQFDGTINTQGIQTSYGIDVDQYDISAFLSPGQTSGTTTYSSGEDLVLLMAQVVSATSDPAVDLSITKTHSGNFVAGTQRQYTITVANSNAAGVEREDNTITVTDTLPTGLQYVSATGTGWTCGASGQVVTCTRPGPLNIGATAPAITLGVNVLETAAANFNNTATVSTPSFDLNTANNSASDATVVSFPNLSTSTKTVADLNGGEVAPGDTLRYTITLNESGAQNATGVTVTDHVPSNVTWAGFVSIPAGATSSFTAAPAGDNERGVFTVSNVAVPASGSRTIVFDVTVMNVSPGSEIDNTASVTNPNGPDAAPATPTLTVLPSQIPASGTKQLYLWSNGIDLIRTRPTGTHNPVTIDGANGTQTFTMSIPVRAALTLNGGNFPVHLILARSGSSGTSSRTINVTLRNSSTGQVATTSRTINNMPVSPVMYTFTLNTAGMTAPVNSTFSLDVNNSSSFNTRDIALTPYTNALGYSRVELNSATVINVDSVQTWSTAFNGGAQQASYFPGATVFVRAAISDPFGSFDISGARITVRDAANAVQVNNQTMNALGAPATCNSFTATTCTFEYSFTLPATPVPALGTWSISVIGNEGVEGVFDEGVGSFSVVFPQPALTVVKSSAVLSSPVPGLPKRIPGAVVRYDISVTNSGPGIVDANTLVITDPIPADSAMYVGTASGNPVVFVNGATPSGLTYNYAAHVRYSNVGVSGPWTYTPLPDSNGFDSAVRAIRVAPAGAMSAASGGNPGFTLQFQVRIR